MFADIVGEKLQVIRKLQLTPKLLVTAEVESAEKTRSVLVTELPADTPAWLRELHPLLLRPEITAVAL